MSTKETRAPTVSRSWRSRPRGGAQGRGLGGRASPRPGRRGMRDRYRHRRARNDGEPGTTCFATGAPNGCHRCRAADDDQRRRGACWRCATGFRGQIYSVGSACAAGAHAIGVATRMIQSGDADAVLAGGAEATLTPLATAAFAAMEATSKTGISRPFDARRDGFVMGEGAGVLVLEERRRGTRARRRVLGEVLGYASTSDAHHLTAPEPEGRGAAEAIRRALKDADLAAERDRLRQRPRHLDAAERPSRDERPEVRARRARRARAGVLDEVGDRPPARRGGRGRGGRHGAGAARARSAADPRLRAARRRHGSRLRPRHSQAACAAPESRPAVGLSNSFGFGGHNAVLCLGAAA